jgi:hypothetical protein
LFRQVFSLGPAPADAPFSQTLPASLNRLYPARPRKPRLRHLATGLYEALYSQSVPFRVLTRLGTPGGTLQVYRSLVDWTNALQRTPTSGIPAIPPVDFSKEEIISIDFESGDSNSAGEIVGVEPQLEGLLLRVVRWNPDPGPPVSTFEGWISETIAIPRSSLPVLMAPLLVGTFSQRTALLTPPTPMPGATPLYTPSPTIPPLPLPAPLNPTPAPSASPGP